MAILAFQKPDKVLMLEADSRFGKFEFRPLEPGFGITVGNALRRILLSSLEGFAITTIRIDGVEHEFSSVPGVKEDVTNIILNLKQVRFKQVVEEFESEKVSITVENSSEFKAGDIGKYLTGFEVLNPELVICHLDSKSTMQIDITINKDRITTGLPATVNYQGNKYPLKITKVVPEVKDRMFDVDLVFTGDMPDNVRVGKSFRVQIELGQPEQALIIPRGNFYQSTGGQWIYKVNTSKTKAVRVPLSIGRQNPQQYEIVEGLQPGDWVITTGYDTFGDAEELILK